MQISEHFSLAELVRSDVAARLGLNNTPDDATIVRLQAVCHNILEPVRLHFGRPVRINSGYRSPKVNVAAGSTSTSSQHIKGEAVDFEIAGVSNYDLAVYVRDHLNFDQLILEAYTRGVPSSGWVHCSWSRARLRGEVLTMSKGRYSIGLLP